MAQEQNPKENHMKLVGSATEKQLAIFTLWYLSFKYDENKLRAVPDMTYHIDKHLMSMLWSIVSKAADKSSTVSAVALPLSIFRVTSLCTF